MDVGQIARRFPLVARPHPPCPSLADRVREISDLADAAKREAKVTSATVALNKAALIASDCGLPELARVLCWRHTQGFLRAQPLGAQEARYALEPLVNLARLRIRDGDGAGAYQLLDSLNQAVKAKSEAVIDGHPISFRHLTHSTVDHQQVCQWLWTILLGDGTRALVTAGQWGRARTHCEQLRGIGKRLFDGRQVEVLGRCLDGQPKEALEFLSNSTLSEAWERPVAACLAMLCLTAAGARNAGSTATMVKQYQALDQTPELAVFRSRVGLAMLDLSSHNQQFGLARQLIQGAITHADGYVARDVLDHATCRDRMTQDELHTVSDLLISTGLGQGRIPAHLQQSLLGAVELSTQVANHHLAGRHPAL
ncbi:hypothetical protein [Streptomyces sp. NPDC005898]|uniref:hypothetical protein n=1 Tax=Streptomyces sp. NPDC005898 TaxID=3157082 RepID=UPI00340B9558